MSFARNYRRFRWITLLLLLTALMYQFGQLLIAVLLGLLTLIVIFYWIRRMVMDWKSDEENEN